MLGRRVRRLRARLAKEGLEGVVMAPGPNVRYYTDVNSHLLERPFLFFVPTEGEPQLVAPTLESGPYSRAPMKVVVHSWDDASGPSGAFEALGKEVRLRGRWGCEGRVPFGYVTHLRRRGLSLEPADHVLQGIRETKDETEVAVLKKAAEILAQAFLEVPRIAAAGKTEMQVAKEFTAEVLSRGGESVDFCSVQAGKDAADPHWAPSTVRLRNNEGYLIDAGCTLEGYNADITRTFVIGRNKEVQEAYEDVIAAQVAALNSVRPGRTTGDVDHAARSSLEAAGRAAQFFHRTGHGLGLEIHEEPYIVPGGKKTLSRGMSFTVEPGVYVKGRCGVRIEDDVIVTGTGVDVTTSKVPKEFGWWAR